MRSIRKIRVLGFQLALAMPIAAAVGCGQASDSKLAASNALSNGDPFVAIDRPLSTNAQALAVQSVPGASAPQSFYLAINKKELGQRWFLTAYAKDLFPGTVGFGAANSIGVRVVTFRLQNGKLFVFDASNNFKDSDTFDPELILEAYPIVSLPSFDGLVGSEDYVLFDPAAGLNRFGIISDAFAQGTQPAHFPIDLAFLQNFRKINDGITYEEVFTGAADIPEIAPGSLEPNVFKVSGTIGLSLRRYAEGSGYVPTPMPQKELYFRSDAHMVPNTGTTYQTAIKWNIHPGMKPITWLISDQIAKLADDPVYGAYDVFGAVKRGIENWNAVFGFPVLEGKVATAADSYADDDKNFIIFDGDPTYGYAFANWRANPNTGEVRGASVYFNAIWLTILSQFSDDPKVSGAAPQQMSPIAAPRPVPMLTWNGMRNDPLCVMSAADALAQDGASAITPFRTKKEKFEGFISHLINHEIGHTLGLRHNFKGSLIPPSSSVMEYALNQDRSRLDKPQAYDIAAIRLLYGLSNEMPAQPFCTDEDVANDVDCSRFDFGADPLSVDEGPDYANTLQAFLAGTGPLSTGRKINRLLKYVRGGSAAQRLQAWNFAIGPLKVPADANAVSTIPGYAARVDQAAATLFSRLYLDSPDARTDVWNPGVFLNDPPFDPAVTPLLITELEANLINADSIRSYATRRIAVAVLEKLQLTAALDALVSARDTIRAARPGLHGDDATLTDELLSHIDSAINNYFTR